MFMNDSSFEDDGGRKPKRGSMADTVSDTVESLSIDDKRSGKGYGAPHPNSLKDDEDIESIVGGDDYLSGSRTNVIQQQRDLQKKKLQERMGGGVVRTSLPKQYSAPRSMDVDDKPSRFGRDDDDDDDVVPVRRGTSGTARSGSRGYTADASYPRRGVDDDDDRKPRRTGGVDYRDRGGRDADYDRDYDRDRERGGGRGSTDRERDRGGRGDWDRERGSDRDRERERERERGGSDRSRERERDRDFDRNDRERDRGRDDRDVTPKSRSNTSSDRGRSTSRDKDDYTDRRRASKDFEPVPAKTDKFAAKRTGGRSDRDDDDDDSRRVRGTSKNHVTARDRSRSRSHSRSRSRSRSASPDFSSDDERNDDNAATTYDPSSSKPRGSATVKKPKLDMADMKAFLLRPIPKAYDVVECYIERNKSGANKMFPEYCLYMKEGDRFLLTAKKRPKNRTSNYLISMQRGDLSRRGSDNYIGKLRANFLGTEFAIYDNGVNPKDADTQTITSNPAGIRQELGISMYAANVLGHRGPRKMKVCVPRVREDGTRVVWRPLTKEDEMINKCKEQDHTNLTYLINKPPRWNDQVCAYVLNFNGRVTMASVKNFQLVTPEDQETVVLQFGRVGKDLFTMDFRWPLCPLQAFAITLSSFDSKLACDAPGLEEMKSNGSARTLLPASGRTALTSPLSSSSSFSSRMSPTSGKKRRSVTDNKTHPTGSGQSSSRMVSPPHEAFPYAMESMMSTQTAGIGVPDHGFLYQLQQLQHHQGMTAAAAAAYGYPSGGIQPMAPGFPVSQYMGAPQTIPRAPSMNSVTDDNLGRHFGSTYQETGSAQPVQGPSPANNSVDAASNGDQDGASLIQRLEKKDHMISQLGSFLSQMKQESEGTANAWKEKLQEIADLKRQLAVVTQQLTAAQDKERETAFQLEQTGQELGSATQILKESEQTHIDELTIMNEEIKKRQSEADHMKVGYEQSLKDISQELLKTQQKLEEAASRCHSLEEALQKIEEGHRMVLNQHEEERGGLRKNLDELGGHLETSDREKQELGQHLWNITQELQQAKQHEDELERKCTSVMGELKKSQVAWSERFHHFQNEKAEQLGVHSMLQTQLQELNEKFQNERSQKEELNELMVREVQRFHDEMEHLQQSHKETVEREMDEKEQWKLQALDYEDKLTRMENKFAQASSDLEELQGRLRQIDEENQYLQQNGTEKASTLQEMNNQLHQMMGELQDTQCRYEQLQVQWEHHQNGLRTCMQLLSSKGNLESGSTDSFPSRITAALEEFVQLSSVMDEMKISVLRAQQDLDSDRERFRQREQELLQQCQGFQIDLETTRTDAKTLAQELQQLSRQSGGNESKLSAQVQQLTKELEEVRMNSGLQVLQLQKSLDSQRTRTNQLENEKKDLLQEAEHLNSSMEALYQARNEKQIELDQLRATWKELQLEHSDLRENYDDLDVRSTCTVDELNAKLKELQTQVQTLRSQSNVLRTENEQMLEQLNSIQTEYESLSHRYMSDQAKWLEKEQELGAVLEDKTHRMDEMMEMLTQFQSKTDFLEKSRMNEDQSVRQEIEKYQQQLLGLGQEKKRFEVAYTSLKAQHDQVVQEAFTLKEEKRLFAQQQNDTEEELGALKTEHTRMKGEFERVSRTKSSLQAELHRVTDEAQDVLRQFELIRRDARAQEKNYQSELEQMRKEVEDLRTEGNDANALVEEMQTKMTSIQNAANATINDLMTELQNAQETISYEKSRLHKENEMLKSQLKAIDEDVRRKELDLKELQTGLRLEKNHFSDKENEMMLKFSRLTNTLDQKKQEVDKLSKELEAKALKVAEYERKLTPLANAKDSLQAKNAELKQAFDAKTREMHDIEERFRDDMAKVMKEKREIESLYMTMKEEYESVRSQTSGHQQQWQSDCKALKQNLERTKSELIKANTEVLTLTQRLESCQGAANETISELSARLQVAEQQKEMSVNGLQREINLERERRREAEVQKMELQRLLRQKGAPSSASGSISSSTSAAMEDRSAWSGSSGVFEIETSSNIPPKSAHSVSNNAAFATTTPAQPAQTVTSKTKQQSVVAAAPSLEIQKFYANEPMTNAELSNLPMALIKAQIGLDLSSSDQTSSSGTKQNSSSSPMKSSHLFRASPSLSLHDRDLYHHRQENNDDIPPLPLEKLPQSPEADSNETSPSCDTEHNSTGHRSSLPGASSSAASYLASLSSRSTERFFMDLTDGKNRLATSKSNGSSSGSGNNSSKKLSAMSNSSSSNKKKRPSIGLPSSASSGALVAAYALPSSSPSSSPASGAQKSKSTSKLLPRIP